MPREARESGPVAPEIVLQAEVGGFTIAITELLAGATAEKLNERLDTYRRAIERQRAHNSLVEALVDLVARREALASWDERRTAALKALADEQVRQRAAFESSNQVGARTRRSEGLTTQQQQALDQFRERRVAEEAKFHAEKANLEAEIPRYEAQVARQRAIIAGRDRSEVIGTPMPTAEAAD